MEVTKFLRVSGVPEGAAAAEDGPLHYRYIAFTWLAHDFFPGLLKILLARALAGRR